MNQEQLKEIFRSKYEPSEWKKVLLALFPGTEFFKVPESLEFANKQQQQDTNGIRVLGDTVLSDKSRIQFFEVELKDSKEATKSRAGLRNLIYSNVIPGDVDGILATYYNPKAKEWRVSFISKSLYWDEESNKVQTETNPMRYTYVLGEERNRTAVERFMTIIGAGKPPVLVDLLKAFSVEKISNEFFEKYRLLFEEFTGFLEDSGNRKLFKQDSDEETEKAIRNFVKKLMGRIVFLYFLQKKGWMGVTNEKWGNGDKEFMRNLYDKCKDKNNFYQQCLVPLFFKTLNKERDDHMFSVTKTQVPFLNGGLFDKADDEPTDIKIAQKHFDNLFEFFNNYNFTIDENAPDDQDVGIDPEMLGRIFENLLEDNRKHGTFYTPKEVVHFMCKESLSLYLQNSLGAKLSAGEARELDMFIKGQTEDVPKIVKTYAAEIDKHLNQVTICDPAIGSGAFPMGMVYEIFQLKHKLLSYLKPKEFIPVNVKKDIIRNSIYGVDIEKGAVDIARLRFWLALVVDETVPSPLPNLDYRIMQGDSLVESFEGVPLDTVDCKAPYNVDNGQIDMFSDHLVDGQTSIGFSAKQRQNLQELALAYFDPNNSKDKPKINKQIDEIVHDHIKANFQLEANRIEKHIGSLEHRTDLLKKHKPNSEGDKNKKQQGLAKLEKVLAIWEKAHKQLKKKEKLLHEIQDKDEKPYFLWNLFFNEVLQEGKKGFDIVIGNPPYGVKVSEELRDLYKLGNKDSYGLFMSMAMSKLMKANGVLSFIVSDTWLTLKSHYELRQQVLQYKLNKVIRVHQDCFDATVNACIYTLVKTPPAPAHKLIAADLTNVSTRKDVPAFREKIFRLESLVDEANIEYAVYEYEQSLLHSYSGIPVFVAHPKLYTLLNDTNAETTKIILDADDDRREVNQRAVLMNGKKVLLISFGDIAEIRQGLATGDNDYYLYQNPDARGTYKDINDYSKYLLKEDDLQKIYSDEKIRQKVIESGIHQTKAEKSFDKDRWFGGRYILPYDKGGESDTDSGWLPNYYVPTNYFIDWSATAVKRLKKYTIANRIKDKGETKTIKDSYKTTTAAVIRNKETYFLKGITFSRTGIYSPSFRINSVSVYDTEGSTIFLHPLLNVYASIAIANSRVMRYVLKNYIGHTVHTQVDELKEMPYAILHHKDLPVLVGKIVEKQKQNPMYDYIANEQKQIDKLVYEAYGLNQEDINEVETWFARRYPKLKKYADIKPIAKKAGLTASEESHFYKSLIQRGENKYVEFKSTLRWDIKEGKVNKVMELMVGKTIAAFANSGGGTLFIGVDDQKQVLGLDLDYNTFKGQDKQDEFRKHFDQMVQNYFGNGFVGNVNGEFHTIDGKEVCVVEVKPVKSRNCFLVNKEKNNEQEYYVRRLASTVKLTPREMVEYLQSEQEEEAGVKKTASRKKVQEVE